MANDHEIDARPGGRVSLSQLRAFDMVSRTLNFGEAARVLNVAQPSISRSIATLERSLGVRLLSRGTIPVSLTAEGISILGPVRRAIASADEIPAAIHGRSGPLRLGVLEGAAASILTSVYRDGRIGPFEVTIEPLTWQSGFDPLSDRRIDAAVSYLPLMLPSNVQYEVLERVAPVAVVPRASRLAGRRSCHLGDFVGETLFVSPTHSIWQANFDALSRAVGTDDLRFETVPSAFAAVDRVACGLGAYLAADVRNVPRADGVLVLPLAGLEQVRVALVWQELTADSPIHDLRAILMGHSPS